jgi:hypothetical protein
MGEYFGIKPPEKASIKHSNSVILDAVISDSVMQVVCAVKSLFSLLADWST